MKPKSPPAATYRNHALHRAILELYASYAGHPYACRVHREAARILRE